MNGGRATVAPTLVVTQTTTIAGEKRFAKLTGAIGFDTAGIAVGEAEASIAALAAENAIGEFGETALRKALKINLLNKIMPSHYLVTPFCQ